MFHSDDIARLAEENAAVLQELTALETHLKDRFHRLDEAIRCLILALASGEPMLLLGPPGTAKSLLVRTLAEAIGIGGRDGVASGEGLYFEYLLTQFTEPSELFGYLNLGALAKGERDIRREDTGMMQHAQVIFLDEIFNASSAILNALLTFMNERKFHDRGKVTGVRMRNLFAAANQPPRDPALVAMFDRFLLRTTVEQVPPAAAELGGLVETGWRMTFDRPTRAPGFAGLIDRAATLRDAIDRANGQGKLRIDPTSGFFVGLEKWVAELRWHEASIMSNRRLIKFSRIMLIDRMLALSAGESAASLGERELKLLLKYGLDRHDTGVEAKLEQEAEFLIPRS